MTTNDISNAVYGVFADPSVTYAFSHGLYLGATIVGVLFGFTILRSIVSDGHEDI